MLNLCIFVHYSHNFLSFHCVYVQDGNLKPFMNSEPSPETNNEPVKVIVADSLHDLVINSGKNGLSFSNILLVASFIFSAYGR